MQPLCEREPGPMEHVKIERKCTVMYSNTGVKVTCGIMILIDLQFLH